MTSGPAHALPPLLLEHADLRAAGLALDHCQDFRVGDKGCPRDHFTAVFFDEEHLIQRQLGTGLSRRALEGTIALRSPRIVYVSCDVATLARDARAIVEAGYEMAELALFDLFPNTAHVESVVVFDLRVNSPAV